MSERARPVHASSAMKAGARLLGLASLAAGVFDVVWGEFEPAHQPIQALGDHVPGVTILAYLAGAWLIAGGAALLVRGASRFGAASLALIYALFAAFWLPRFVTAPRVLGHHAGVYIGVAGGVGMQAVVVVAALILYAWATGETPLGRGAALTARWLFGACVVLFGLTQLTGVRDTARMVPGWIPLGGDFWAVFTGIAFVLAGLAIPSGILDVLAARLLAAMLLVFSALALLPLVFTAPRNHVSWGANAYNLAAVASAWIMAAWLERLGDSGEADAKMAAELG